VAEDPTLKALAAVAAQLVEQRQLAEKAGRESQALEKARIASLAASARRRRREMLVRSQVASLEQRARRLEDEAAAIEAERDALAKMRREARDDLERARVRAQAPNSYAILPFRGPNGTWRKPIVFDCGDGHAKMLPNGPSFSLLDLSDDVSIRLNPLSAAVGLVAAKLQKSASPDGAPVVPYILFLIRPDGIRPYYAARASLEGLGLAFGYELIDQDWDIEIDNDDPASAPAASRAVADHARPWPGNRRGRSDASSSSDPGTTDGSGPGASGDAIARGDYYNGGTGRGRSPSDRDGDGGWVVNPGSSSPVPEGGSPVAGRGGGTPGSGGLAPWPSTPGGRTGGGGQLANGSGALPWSAPGGTPGPVGGTPLPPPDVSEIVAPPEASGSGAGVGTEDGTGGGTQPQGTRGGPRIPVLEPVPTSPEGSGPIATPPSSTTNGVGSTAGQGQTAAKGTGADASVVSAPEGGGQESSPPDPSGSTAAKSGSRSQTQSTSTTGAGSSTVQDCPDSSNSSNRTGSSRSPSGSPSLAGALGGAPRPGFGLPSPSGGASSRSPEAGVRRGLALPHGMLVERRPDQALELIVSCGPKGLTLQPGGYRVSATSLDEGKVSLPRVLRSIVNSSQGAQPNVTVRPEIHFLVEAGGQETYWKARRQTALAGLGWPTSLRVAEAEPLRWLREEVR
jgi:hypothetical protein